MESSSKSKKCITYRRAGHFSGLENIRKQGYLCDLIINVDHRSFHTHKVVLVATMSYFKNMFINNLVDRDKKTVTICNVQSENVEAFITFAYTGEITLTEDNVQSLLKDADYFDLVDIKDECSKFLESCLHDRNAYELYQLAETLNCCSLKEKSKKIMRQSIKEVSQTNEYLNMDLVHLKDILSNSEMQASSQIIQFEAVMKWILYKTNQRKTHLSDLLRFVKLSDLSTDYLVAYFFKGGETSISHQHNDLMMEVMSAYKTIEKSSLEIKKERILVVDNFDSTRIEIYDPIKDTWKLTKTGKDPKKYFSGTTHDGKLYLLGGKMYFNYVTSVQAYEPQNELWTELSPMHYSRGASGITALNGFLYLCGNREREERYDIRNDKWTKMSPMNCERCTHAVIAFQGFIYVIGGITDTPSFLNSVERYDPQSDQWTLVAPMKQEREDCGVAVFNGKLYVCGGYFQTTILQSVEVYDPVTDSWEYVASMKAARFGALVVVNMGKLWAIGGVGKSYAHLSSVEVYDPETNAWYYVKRLSKIKGAVKGGILSYY